MKPTKAPSSPTASDALATSTPELRFAGFDEPWEQRKLGDVADRHDNLRIPIAAKDRIAGSTPYYGANGIQDYVAGFTHIGEFILVAEDGVTDISDYPIHLVNGMIWVNNHAHVIQAISKLSSNHFIKTALKSIDFNGILVGGTRSKLNAQVLMNLIIDMPNIKEQRQIGSLFSRIDSIITLHQRKLELLKNIKKSLLDKMFPKPGESVPEIRFAGFTDAWEQRKLGDVVTIARGASPRPIESFVTDSPDGLNWVKIGDAPTMGRHITSTSEKIKPEGLSKTRQVFPGDLILSNSMSFGRPYIMSISGCIHDGWLLIRNSTNSFDPLYLCQMLGTKQMLDQYRMFAAGSTVNNLNKELVGNANVFIPEIEEQRRIGSFFSRIDSIITLHQRKLELLKNIKKALLDKMFV